PSAWWGAIWATPFGGDAAPAFSDVEERRRVGTLAALGVIVASRHRRVCQICVCATRGLTQRSRIAMDVRPTGPRNPPQFWGPCARGHPLLQLHPRERDLTSRDRAHYTRDRFSALCTPGRGRCHVRVR